MSVRLFKAWVTGDFYRCDDKCPEESDHFIAIPDTPATRKILWEAKDALTFGEASDYYDAAQTLLKLFEEEK